MTDSSLIADLIRSGVAPELIQRVTEALVEAAKPTQNTPIQSSNAIRCARYRESKKHVKPCQNHVASVSEHNSPSPSFPLSPLSPTPPIPTHTHTPPPTRPRKERVTAANASGGELALSDPKTKRQPVPSTADPRHSQFIRLWTEAWPEAFFGETYPFQKLDGIQLSELLKTSKLSAEELMTGVKWCWKESETNPRADWSVKQAGTIRGFCINYANILRANKARQP